MCDETGADRVRPGQKEGWDKAEGGGRQQAMGRAQAGADGQSREHRGKGEKQRGM